MAGNQAMEATTVLDELVTHYDATKEYFDVDNNFMAKFHNSLGVNWNIYTPEGRRFKFYFAQGFATLTGRVIAGWKDFCQEENINNGDRVVFHYLGFSKFKFIREAVPQNAQ
ncbi:hypothetical protein RIF29_21944 [Crotalaria pallida]|uniref:TF-B3 domain-containing protein n=1 Tax=Crotalaria pallida TaxID=3830 RepID=A0AAN9F5I3_CROPI